MKERGKMSYSASWRFECPKCGGERFGTSNCMSSEDMWIGHCHGSEDRPGCGFTWKRSEDKSVRAPKNREDLLEEALLRVLDSGCPKDTNGDGDCGSKSCPYCGDGIKALLNQDDVGCI